MYHYRYVAKVEVVEEMELIGWLYQATSLPQASDFQIRLGYTPVALAVASAASLTGVLGLPDSTNETTFSIASECPAMKVSVVTQIAWGERV